MELGTTIVSDQIQSSLGAAEMSDSFVVNIENLAPSTVEDNSSANSRITVKLQRNFSSKGSQRGDGINTPLSAFSAVTDRSSTGTSMFGGCSPKRYVPVASFGTKESFNRQPQKTITITEGNRSSSRKYFKHRTSFIDPRRVLLFFATLSSMGTMLLIYLTLSISKFSGDSNTQTQQ